MTIKHYTFISDIKSLSVKLEQWFFYAVKLEQWFFYDCLNNTGQDAVNNILVDRISIIYNFAKPAFKSRIWAFFTNL